MINQVPTRMNSTIDFIMVECDPCNLSGFHFLKPRIQYEMMYMLLNL